MRVPRTAACAAAEEVAVGLGARAAGEPHIPKSVSALGSVGSRGGLSRLGIDLVKRARLPLALVDELLRQVREVRVLDTRLRVRGRRRAVHFLQVRHSSPLSAWVLELTSLNRSVTDCQSGIPRL